MNTPTPTEDGPAEPLAVAAGSALTFKQERQAHWWKTFLARRRFPLKGHFFLVPEDDAPWCANLVHETGRKIDFILDHGETWAESRATFAAALPAGVVCLPTCCDPQTAPRPDPRVLPNTGDVARAQNGLPPKE